MARPQLHRTDTIEAIAEVSGAQIGTIYHRFGSRHRS
jgi:hypothetical protein